MGYRYFMENELIFECGMSMESQLNAFDVLSEAGAIKLIMLVKEKTEIMTVDIKTIPGNYYRLKGVLDKLSELEILDKKIIEKTLFDV